MIRSSLLPAAIVLGVGSFACLSSAQIERSVQAHGGLEKWQRFSAVEFDSTFENAKGTKRDHQLFNLRNRDGLITAEAYTLGASHGQVWIKPALDALGGTPPRFYMWTPFYFFAMPFVFADPGASHQSLGKKNFQGREYDAVKISYQAGTGDSPDDVYTAYVDPESGRLRAAVYVVTFPALRKGKSIAELEQHAISFDEWQEVDGLTVPKFAQYYSWKNEEPEGDALGKMTFANVRFSVPAPDESKFTKPPDAVVAPLE